MNTSPKILSSFPAFGVDLSITQLQPFCEWLLTQRSLAKKKPVLILPTTMNELMQAHHFLDFRKTLRQFKYLVTDGMPLVWLARLHNPKTERIYGPDLMMAVIQKGQKLGTRHHLYGASQSVLAQLTRQLKKRFPEAKIVGTYAPPFRALTQKEERTVAEKIDKVYPDFVWVSLGGRKQVEWAVRMRNKLRVKYIIPVGAAFDFIAGTKPQAPRWLQSIGLEWLFRLGSEPGRLARRYVLQIPIFLVLWVAEAVKIFLRKLRSF